MKYHMLNDVGSKYVSGKDQFDATIKSMPVPQLPSLGQVDGLRSFNGYLYWVNYLDVR